MNLRIRGENQHHLFAGLGEQDHGTTVLLCIKAVVRESLASIIVLCVNKYENIVKCEGRP